MKTVLVIGLFAAGVLLYLAYRWLSRQAVIISDYHKLMRDLITNEKYQVKGKFD